jgi:hypothetical protein
VEPLARVSPSTLASLLQTNSYFEESGYVMAGERAKKINAQRPVAPLVYPRRPLRRRIRLKEAESPATGWWAQQGSNLRPAD